MLVRCAIDGHELSYAVLVESATIRQESTEAISTCELSFFKAFGEAYYDDARYDRASFYSLMPKEWSEVVVYDADTSQILFGGFCMRIDRDLEGPHLIRRISCSDWGILLERTIITQSWPDGTPDSTIIADALKQVPEIQPGTIVTLVAQLGAIEAKDMRIRDLLDDISQLTGGEWHVSYTGKLNYYRIGSIVPPFNLSDHPDYVTTQPYALEDFQSDFADAANRIRVLGAITDGATEITALAEDVSSQQRYGVLSATVVDRNLLDTANASLVAYTELARRAWPSPTVSVTVWAPGLARGQTVSIETKRYGVGGQFVLRSLTIVIVAPDRKRIPEYGHKLKYTAEFGTRTPDLVYTLRRMQRRPVERTQQPAAVIPPGSITWDDFASGIAPVFNVDRKPSGAEWANYPQDATFLNRTDRKLYRRIANNDWTAVVPTGDLEGQVAAIKILQPGSVTETILADGSVVTAKIPDGAIKGPKLAAGSVEANAIAANAIYAEAIQSDAIKSRHITAGEIVAGKLGALAVVAGNVAADAITAGTIAAGAVRAGCIYTDAVTAGCVAAGAIRAEDAAFAVAAIQSADIKELRGDKIVANTIDSTKLNSVEINVGYAPPGVTDKPGRLAVYGSSGTVVAMMGNLAGAGASGNFGIWAKLGSFGGTGYSDAPLYTDSAGNLFMRNTEFTLTSGTQAVYIKKNTFQPNTTLIGVNVTDGTNQSWNVGRGIAMYYGASQTQIGALVADPNNTANLQLVLYESAGVISVLADGKAGYVQAKSFRIGTTTVINTAGNWAGGYANAFDGPGVNCPNNGVACAGVNPKVGGVQYNGWSSATFTTADGKTITVKGGIIVSVV